MISTSVVQRFLPIGGRVASGGVIRDKSVIVISTYRPLHQQHRARSTATTEDSINGGAKEQEQGPQPKYFKLCRFQSKKRGSSNSDDIRVGVVAGNDYVYDLTTSAGITSLSSLLEKHKDSATVAEKISKLMEDKKDKMEKYRFSSIRLLSPVERQEVWGTDITYFKRKQNIAKKSASSRAYEQVYTVYERPDLFFKSTPEKVVLPNKQVAIRHDSELTVPEPELALVCNSSGCIVGYTIGNDMTALDIEAQNPLFLTQAKVYSHSCSVGPWVLVGPTLRDITKWRISMTVSRPSAPNESAAVSAAPTVQGADSAETTSATDLQQVQEEQEGGKEDADAEAKEADEKPRQKQQQQQQQNRTVVYQGYCLVRHMKRSPIALTNYLFRANNFDHGVILLTGTGVVPPNNFKLQAGDVVRIEIPQIGALYNKVVSTTKFRK